MIYFWSSQVKFKQGSPVPVQGKNRSQVERIKGFTLTA